MCQMCMSVHLFALFLIVFSNFSIGHDSLVYPSTDSFVFMRVKVLREQPNAAVTITYIYDDAGNC